MEDLCILNTQDSQPLKPLNAVDVSPTIKATFGDCVPSLPPEPATGQDIIIAVMGATGVGKSSFINLATGNDDVRVGHELRSCTSKVQAVCCRHPDGSGRNVVLLDTPGFDDTHLTDTEILIAIADWLTETYKHGILLTGLLFLHRISDNRIGGKSWRNAGVFENLCGKQALRNVILVTTMWDSVDEETGSAREDELRNEYWKSMTTAGARMARFDHTFHRAWDILSQFSGSHQPLQLQVEMGDEGKSLLETSAGASLIHWLDRLIVQFRRIIEALEQLLKGGNSTITAELKRKKLDVQRKFSQVKEQKKHLVGGQQTKRSTIPFVKAVTTLWKPNPSRRGSYTSESFSTSSSELSPSKTEMPDSSSGRRPMAATVTVLRHLRDAADIAPVPFLRGILCLTLTITESIDAMGSTQNSLKALANSARVLIGAIKAQLQVGGISEDMRQAIQDLYKELNNVHTIIQNAPSRGSLSRYVFQPADEGVFASCNESIHNALQLFEVRSAIIIYQKIAQIEARLRPAPTPRATL